MEYVMSTISLPGSRFVRIEADDPHVSLEPGLVVWLDKPQRYCRHIMVYEVTRESVRFRKVEHCHVGTVGDDGKLRAVRSSMKRRGRRVFTVRRRTWALWQEDPGYRVVGRMLADPPTTEVPPPLHVPAVRPR